MAEILVPARGSSFSGLVTSGNTGFGLLGPWPVGTILDKIRWNFVIGGAGVTTFAAVVTPSSIANDQAFRTGQPILSSSTSLTAGVPTQVITSGAAILVEPIEWAIGIKITSGSRFCVVRLAFAAVGNSVSFVASVTAKELFDAGD